MKSKILSFVLLLCVGFLSAQTTVTQPITSNQTFTVPCGVKEIFVEAVGGGGGGGYIEGAQVSGGGGGGAYASKTISVSPGDTFSVIVGSGGTGLTSNNDGGDSSFSNFNGTIVLAKGGNGATKNNHTGANGGSSSTSIGDNKYSGGKGGNANKKTPHVLSSGGGGGGAGFATNNGEDGKDGQIEYTGGWIPIPYGVGGEGGNSAAPGGDGGFGASVGVTKGEDGENYGGGGGGSGSWGIFDRDGGAGAPGVILITYTVEGGFQPPITEIEQINLDNDAIGCLTNIVTLEADGGSLGNGASTLWFEGNDCLELAHIEEFTGFNFAGIGILNNATFQGITDGVARLLTTTGDPQIDMTNIFSSQINPVKYKYISIRYKVVDTQSAGNVQIYFKKNGQILHDDRRVDGTLISDDKYHILNIDMSTNTQWNNTNGNITGWRFDFATVNNRTVMIDYIVLSSKPLIETTNNHNSDDTVLTYTLDTESKTIGSMRIAEFLSTENHCDFTTQKTNCTFTTLARKDKTYQGIGDWSEAAKWTFNSLPVSGSCVRIPTGSFATVDIPDAIAGTLIVNSGGKLEISGNSALTVENGITNQATANDFVIKTDGNLLQTNNIAVNTGSIKAERYLTGIDTDIVNKMDYIYWSSPVADQILKGPSGFSPGTPIEPQYYGFLQYNESNDLFYNTGDTNFEIGKGYAIRAENNNGQPYDKTYSFSGKPNNGNYNYPIFKNNEGYNLVGNPYPSNIRAENLWAINPDLETVVYLWTNALTYDQYQQGGSYSGNNYAIYNQTGGTPPTAGANQAMEFKPDGIIKIGQGFIVQANSSGQINFSNIIRDSESGIFYSKEQKDRFWLSMTSPSQIVNTTLIGYIPGAVNDYDKGFDAEFWGASDAIYSIIPETQLIIQGKEYPLDTNDIVPLGYKAFETGTYIIQVHKKEGIFAEAQKIFLVDKLLNKTVNLSAKPYKFLTRAGEFNDRFEIIYKNKNTISTVQDVVEPLLITVTRQSDDLLIMSKGDNLSEVTVYNLLGKPVFTYKDLNTEELRIPAAEYSKQILIVNIVTQSGRTASQKVIPK